MSTPASVINICSNVRLNNRYEHTIYFSSADAQHSYFSGKVVKTFSAYSYLRKSWSIKVNATMEQARTWSYLFFHNLQNGSAKIYYYFITNIEYINDSTVELSLELDVMQTYMFDYTLLSSFVEREHVASDNIGEHIVDEGLELGDFRVIDETIVSELNDLCLLMLSTIKPNTTTQDGTDEIEYLDIQSSYVDGIFSGPGVFAVNIQSDWKGLGTQLYLLSKDGKEGAIMTMWMYPKPLVSLAEGYSWNSGTITKDVASSTSFSKHVERNDKTSGVYEPRNKKLLTYPFNFIYISNNSGESGVYRYERFGDPSYCNFKVIGCLSPEGSVKIYPLNYNGLTHNYEESLTLKGFPTCAWNSDVYKLWLAQNQEQQNLTWATGAAKISAGTLGLITTSGASAGVSGGLVISGLSDVFHLIAQKADKEIQPPQARGQYSSSVNTAHNHHTFMIQRKSIGKEYAKIIDDYFDMYGYKISQVKVPNRHVRKNWTYTKTIGCHIRGNLCTDDLTKIESIYNNGITFWVNGDSIGNYSLNNDTL